MLKNILILGIFVVTSVSGALAFDLMSQRSGAPIQIDASNGIECDQDKQKCTAKGNIKVTQGDARMTCDQLIAYFKKDTKNQQNIDRIEAMGNVHAWSTKEDRHIYSDYGHYDVNQQFLTLKGTKIRIEADQARLVTSGKATFDQKSMIAHTTARSFMSREDRTLQADTLEAHFMEGKQGEVVLSHITGYGNVVVSSPQDIIEGDKGHYDAKTEVAKMDGNIIVTRADTRITGNSGEVNMRTGQSKILSTQSKSKDRRSQVSILIKQQNQKKS